MTPKGAFLEALRKQVADRQKEVNAYIGFVCDVITKAGVRTRYKEHKYHTTSEWRLDDFYDFSFWANFGLSETGGDTIKIFFSSPAGQKEVFAAYWQNCDNPEISTFDLGEDWREKLNWLITKKEDRLAAFISKQNRAKKGAQILAEKFAADQRELVELRQRAERLGITVDPSKFSVKA